MNYAIRYFNTCRVLPKADEVILLYNEYNENLLEYIKEYKDEQRIILNTTNYAAAALEENLELWIKVKQEHENFSIILSYDENYDNEILIKLKENNISFFFDLRVDTWDKVVGLINKGVSDVYICNDFAFNIVPIAEYCHSKNVKIRVYPNIAQSSLNNCGDTLPQLTKFYIRPEDIDLYEGLVDVCEFYGRVDKQSVLYEIYHDKVWRGDLSELILGLDERITNIAVLPDFGQSRLNCGKKCLQGKCHICERIVLFSQQMDRVREETGMQFEVRRNNDNK